MGVTHDPEGNILVAIGASEKDPGLESSIELFSSNGVHRRTFNLELPRPVGILLVGRDFYVADVANRAVELFTLKENSPRKVSPLRANS